MLDLEIAPHSRRQLQQYQYVMQVDEEAVQKALGEMEEGWREFEDKNRDRAAAMETPSPNQVRDSSCDGRNSSCMCSHCSRHVCCEVGLKDNNCSSVFKGIAAAANSMML